MHMETRELLRQQLVKRRMAPPSEEEVADTAIDLWEQIATQIISIIGEGGFDSLYLRSVSLTHLRDSSLSKLLIFSCRWFLFRKIPLKSKVIFSFSSVVPSI